METPHPVEAASKRSDALQITREPAISPSAGNITAKMLAQQLRELENDGLITRTVYPEVPPRVEYRFSDFGQTLRPILEAIAQWGVENNRHIVAILRQQAD